MNDTPITDKVIQSAISEADSHHDWDEGRCATYALDAVSDGARNLERVAKQLADALEPWRDCPVDSLPCLRNAKAALAAWEKLKASQP